MNNPKARILLVALAILLVPAGAALVYFNLRDRPPPPAVMLNDAEDKGGNSYAAEMSCIDRVLQRSDLQANQVQPALDNCRGSAGAGNSSAGQ